MDTQPISMDTDEIFKKRTIEIPNICSNNNIVNVDLGDTMFEKIKKLIESNETIISKYIERIIYTSILSPQTKKDLNIIYGEVKKEFIITK
jgi:hypothetical protein